MLHFMEVNLDKHKKCVCLLTKKKPLPKEDGSTAWIYKVGSQQTTELYDYDFKNYELCAMDKMHHTTADENQSQDISKNTSYQM